MRVHQQAAYVLVNRPYSETSWIVEVFSRDYGRLSLMAKGARRIKSRLKGSLLPFQPVLISWVGKGEMPTLTSAEIDQSNYTLVEHELRGDALVCGFYCNELIVNLLHRHDPHAKLFDQYSATISALSSIEESAVISDSRSLANALRGFEQMVMKETGYAVDFQHEADGKTLIDANGVYRYYASKGFVRVAEPAATNSNFVSGKIVLSMLDLEAESTLERAPLSNAEVSRGKHLMRDILNQILGQRKIHSRELFFPKERN